MFFLFYGIETPDADIVVPPPTPTPEPTVFGGGIGGVQFRRKLPPVLTFNYAIEKDDEEVIILGEL